MKRTNVRKKEGRIRTMERLKELQEKILNSENQIIITVDYNTVLVCSTVLDAKDRIARIVDDKLWIGGGNMDLFLPSSYIKDSKTRIDSSGLYDTVTTINTTHGFEVKIFI